MTSTPDPGLRDELARIIEEGGTPELLVREKIPDEQNVAAGLEKLFRPSKAKSIRRQSDKIVPQGAFIFSPVQLEKAIQFRERFDAQRRLARDALERPDCQFDIPYEAGFTEIKFLDTVWICARLEAFQAAESLAEDKTRDASKSLSYMLRLASCLAAEGHPTARLEAAFIRTEALNVLQSIVKHPDLTLRQLEALHELSSAQLTGWPNDAAAWIGDRALGMCMYEAIRDGQSVNVLTPEEKQRFEEEDILEALPGAIERTVDRDELYYLTAMRKIINNCSQPYHARAHVFKELRKDLHQKRNSPDFPVVAGRLLLLDIANGHVIQARDRANCEGWVLATALACGREAPSIKINPLTGKEYNVIREAGLIVVKGIGTGENGDDSSMIVPDLVPKTPRK